MDYNIWVGIIIYACTRHAVSQQLMVYVVCSKVQQMCPGPAHYRVLQSPWACRIARLSLSSRFSHIYIHVHMWTVHNRSRYSAASELNCLWTHIRVRLFRGILNSVEPSHLLYVLHIKSSFMYSPDTKCTCVGWSECFMWPYLYCLAGVTVTVSWYPFVYYLFPKAIQDQCAPTCFVPKLGYGIQTTLSLAG